MVEEQGSPESNQDEVEGGGGSGGGDGSGSGVREQDRFLPIANISRIMKKALPANAKIAKDAKETVQECVSEFISFITSEASDKCQREKRKTINGDDLLWAMSTLGFEDYVEPLKVYLHRYRETEGEKASMAKQGEGTMGVPGVPKDAAGKPATPGVGVGVGMGGMPGQAGAGVQMGAAAYGAGGTSAMPYMSPMMTPGGYQMGGGTKWDPSQQLGGSHPGHPL